MASQLQTSSLWQRRNENGKPQAASAPRGSYDAVSQELFARTLYLERKRSERSGRSFVLMLLESRNLLNARSDGQALREVLSVLSAATRETDITGWYEEGRTIGVIFTELGPQVDGGTVVKALLGKVTEALASILTISQLNQLRLSFRVYPERWEGGNRVADTESKFYEDLLHEKPRPRGAQGDGEPRGRPALRRGMGRQGAGLPPGSQGYGRASR